MLSPDRFAGTVKVRLSSEVISAFLSVRVTLAFAGTVETVKLPPSLRLTGSW